MALAILGAIALVSFNDQLETNTLDLPLTAVQRDILAADSDNLGDTNPPDGLSTSVRSEVERAIDRSFVDTFRLLAIIGAVMCWISALVSWLMIENQQAMNTAGG